MHRHGSNLFNYDQGACARRILAPGGVHSSQVEYDEYVVFKAGGEEEEDVDDAVSTSGSIGMRSTVQNDHIAHRFSCDQRSGAQMLEKAFRAGYEIDKMGNFAVERHGGPATDMEGRVRRVICFRRFNPITGAHDLLSLTPEDLSALDLHPATLQYATRTTTESRFWSPDNSHLSLILSFSEVPKTPCDFISMTYDIPSRSANILVRQSWEPRRHNLDDLDEYDHRLESCRAHWAHPLIMPVVLLQVQFMRCEEAVSDNNANVSSVEGEVSTMAGFLEELEASGPKLQRRMSQLTKDGSDDGESWAPLTTTNLMKKAHEVLKGSIKLLDTIRWMERAIRLLILCGDELAERMGEGSVTHAQNPMPGSPRPEADSSAFLTVPSPFRKAPSPPDSVTDHLSDHWHEIRQYLDGLLRLCMGLETDRRMSEARCRAQIDIIYSKMAQEDNVLNARMAVASSRDSSSMKALAVITAIFLPGEFIGTLYGMSMFDWLAPENAEDELGTDTAHVVTNQFWVYWVVTVPLTLLTLFVWRAWWVNQDRYFRRHLSKDLSEERFWTSDGKPRQLERGFLHDLFYLSARREEKVKVEKERTPKEIWEGLPFRKSVSAGSTQRRVLEGRVDDLQRRGTVAV